MSERKISFLYTDKFKSSYKKLCKKYLSLAKDFEVFKKVLCVNPSGIVPNTVQIEGLGQQVFLPIYKARKIPLTCMKTHDSGIRIIYTFDVEFDIFEFIEFIEIYHKNTQTNHDKKFIVDLYDGITDLPSGKAKNKEL